MSGMYVRFTGKNRSSLERDHVRKKISNVFLILTSSRLLIIAVSIFFPLRTSRRIDRASYGILSVEVFGCHAPPIAAAPVTAGVAFLAEIAAAGRLSRSPTTALGRARGWLGFDRLAAAGSVRVLQRIRRVCRSPRSYSLSLSLSF